MYLLTLNDCSHTTLFKEGMKLSKTINQLQMRRMVHIIIAFGLEYYILAALAMLRISFGIILEPEFIALVRAALV